MLATVFFFCVEGSMTKKVREMIVNFNRRIHILRSAFCVVSVSALFLRPPYPLPPVPGVRKKSLGVDMVVLS